MTVEAQAAKNVVETTQAVPAELNLGQRAAYGFGDLGFNLYWTTVSFFVLYYYTDVLGFSGKVAGLIFLIAMLWDAVTDPLVGYLAQRSQARGGTYRAFIVAGSVPLALSLVLLFSNPGLEGAGLVAYALVTHLVFRTAYTFVNIPYSALSAKLTTSSRERSSLSAWRVSLATVGSAFVAYWTLKLVAQFGQGDDSTGFTLAAAVFAALSLPVFATLVLTMREPKAKVATLPATGVWIALKSLSRNTPFLIVMAATICATIGGVIASKTMVYYFKYNLADEEAVGVVFAVNSLMILFAAPFWTFVTGRTSKRFVWQAGAVISILGSAALLFNPIETVPIVVAIAAISSLGSSAGYLTFWSALPDTVEYGELHNGRRDEAFVFGAMSFLQKTAYGVAAAIAGWLLDQTGYVANQVQSTETLSAIKFNLTVLPMVFVAAAFVIIGRYSLDHRKHERIVRLLKRRAGH